jgi:hypothetical protein
MSYEGSKTNTNKRSTPSQKTTSKKDNKSKNMSKGKSISDIVCKNSAQNLNNMIELKNNLKKNNYANDLQNNISEFQKKNEEISKLYADEKNVKNLIDKGDNWKLNNDLFEERTLEILSDVYELKDYNLYPYFDVGFSKTKKSNVIKVYFNKIDLSVEKEETTFSALFLDDIDTYMFQFLEMPMIFHKNDGNYFTLTVISKDFKNSVDFDFKKGDTNEKVTTTSFTFAELSDDLIEIKNKIKELKNEKNYENNETENNENKNNKYNYMSKKLNDIIAKELILPKLDLDEYDIFNKLYKKLIGLKETKILIEKILEKMNKNEKKDFENILLTKQINVIKDNGDEMIDENTVEKVHRKTVKIKHNLK